jgi:hypothetical protein
LDENDPVYRRAKFLLNEANFGAKRDQAITYTMRVLSNYAAIGRDAGSGLLKNENKRVSAQASELLRRVESIRDWQRATINEHPLPLKYTWNWLVQNRKTLDATLVWAHFRDNPMMTVTVEEDKRLTKAGLRSAAGFNRYESVGIKPTILHETPLKILRQRNLA